MEGPVEEPWTGSIETHVMGGEAFDETFFEIRQVLVAMKFNSKKYEGLLKKI